MRASQLEPAIWAPLLKVSRALVLDQALAELDIGDLERGGGGDRRRGVDGAARNVVGGVVLFRARGRADREGDGEDLDTGAASVEAQGGGPQTFVGRLST